MNIDKLLNQYDELNSLDFGDIEKHLITDGSIVRFVGEFAYNYEHFVQTENGIRPYYCEGPASDCPLCAVAAEMAASKDEKISELGSKTYKAKKKYYMNVLDRSPGGRAWHAQTKTAKLLVSNIKATNFGAQLFKALAAVCHTRKQIGQSADPQGFDVILQKEGSKRNTKYGCQYSGIEEPLTPEEMSYDNYDVEKIASISSMADRYNAAKYIAKTTVGFTSEYIGMENQKPTETLTERPADAPPPATPPAMEQKKSKLPPRPQPDKEPDLEAGDGNTPDSPYAPTHPDMKKDSNYNRNFCYEVPCSKCGEEMCVDMRDTRDFQCWKCGEVYEND